MEVTHTLQYKVYAEDNYMQRLILLSPRALRLRGWPPSGQRGVKIYHKDISTDIDEGNRVKAGQVIAKLYARTICAAPSYCTMPFRNA
jgi:hypothetical protein